MGVLGPGLIVYTPPQGACGSIVLTLTCTSSDGAARVNSAIEAGLIKFENPETGEKFEPLGMTTTTITSKLAPLKVESFVESTSFIAVVVGSTLFVVLVVGIVCCCMCSNVQQHHHHHHGSNPDEKAG